MLDKFRLLIDENEKGSEGGFFPLGEGYTWHSGIHLYEKTVNPLLSGDIVAYRQNTDFCFVPRKKEITKDEHDRMCKEEAALYQLIKKEKDPQKNAANLYELKDEVTDNEKKEKASSNFYLVKHSLLEKKLNFYILYNHLYPDELKFKELQKYFNASKDLKAYELPITKTFKYKYVKNQTPLSRSNIIQNENIYPGSWFKNTNINDISQISKIYGASVQNYLIECMFETKKTSVMIPASRLHFTTAFLKIENKNVYQFESNQIYKADNNPTIVGTYSLNKEIKYTEINNDLKIELYGDTNKFIKDSSYLNTHVLLPKQYVGTVLKDEENIYSLRYKSKNETIYAVSPKVSGLTKNNCPLEYTVFNTANIRFLRLINNEIVVLTYQEFKKIIANQLNDNTCLILFCDEEKRIILNMMILRKLDAKEMFSKNNYSNEGSIKNEYIIPAGSLFNKTKNKSLSSIDLSGSDSIKNKLTVFMKLSLTNNKTDLETKIFYKGKNISPIVLGGNGINNWEKVIDNSNNMKFEFSDIIIFLTKPVNTYKRDAFSLCPSEYKSIQSNSEYYICKRYIQNSVLREYQIKKDDIKIEELRGRIDGTVNKDNLMLYNNLDESDSYGSKNPLLEKTDDCEFYSNNIPYFDGNNYTFNSIDIGNGIKYSAVINKSHLQIKIENKDVNIDNKIHFCKIPVTEEDILGFPCADKDNPGQKMFYDASLFLENNFMSEKIKGIEKQYYIYDNLEADKTLYENDITPENIFFPEGTTFSFLYESKVNNKTSYKIAVKDIPVFFNSSDVKKEDTIIRYQFNKKPDICFLDDHGVKNDRPETLYCFNVIDSIYEKYKDKDLDYIGKDPVNGANYNAYYFTAEDMNLSKDFWILENTFKQIKIKQIEPLVLKSEIELKDNIETFICYNENPFQQDKQVEIVPQKIYIPIKTKLVYLEDFDDGKNKAYKIKFSKIPLTINNTFIKELNVKYKIINTPKFINLNGKKVTKESDGELKEFAKNFFDKIDTLKLQEYDFYQKKDNMIGLNIPGDYIFTPFDIWCTKEVIENKENWVDEKTKTGEINQLKQDLAFKYYTKDPLYIYKKEHKVTKESKILRIDDAEILQDINKQNYYAIEIADDNTKLFISESEADKYRTDATEWEKFFKVCETDADENILSNIQDLEKVLELSDEETKDLEKIIEDVNENNSRTDRSTSEIAEIYKRDTETKKTIVKKLRTLNVSHIHELEAKAYDFLKKDKSKQIDYEYLQDRCKETEIWSKIKNDPGFNTSECKNIKCKKDLLTFVNPVYFLNHLEESGISNLHAVELLRVQRKVMSLKCLKRGGVGPRGDNTDTEQTWCNIAVYLTIRALDKNYVNFLINKGESVWYHPEYKSIEPWSNFAEEYSTGYKTSNFWCDVLYYKANEDNSSSIKQAENYKHAQNLANRGKVVIAAWKNPGKRKDSSPHFATVLPGNNVDSLYKLKVANVGWENGEIVLEKAFHTCHAVQFYYNDKQDYYCDLNFGEGMWFTSINKLEELYNK